MKEDVQTELDFLSDPETPLVMVDSELSRTDPLGASLLALEEQFDQRGWDQRPVLLLAFAHDGAVALQEFPMPDFVADNPSHGLPAMANHFTHLMRDQVESDMKMLGVGLEDSADAYGQANDMPLDSAELKYFSARLNPKWAGVILLFEGWTIGPEPDAETEPDQWADYVATAMSRGMHEHPNRQEMRGVIFHDVAGGKRMVERIRGEEPTLQVLGPDDEAGGLLNRALEAFVAVGSILMARKGYQPPQGD